MIGYPLHEGNFLLYCAQNYDNPQCVDTVEFYDDLNRFKYLKRLFNKYAETGELRERLILNHIVIIYNVFGVEAGTRLLFLKLKGFEREIKPFLLLLNSLPDIVSGIGIDNININTVDIGLDPIIVEALRKI